MQKTLLLWLCLACGMPNLASAYDMDVHYYVTSMILVDLDGGKHSLNKTKVLAALANQYVDDNDNTKPVITPWGAQQRRNWHFPASMDEGLLENDYGVVRRNSPYAKHNVNRGLQANDPVLLGMALHTYLDSFAHEGYSAYFGHASAGHDPDRPHLDQPKFKEAVSMVYKILNQWFVNNGAAANPSTISRDKYYGLAAFVPPSYACLTCGYNGGEIRERSDYWKAEIAKQFPNLNLPGYYFMSGADKSRFEQVASSYMTPTQEVDAITLEWAIAQTTNPDFNSPTYFTPQLYLSPQNSVTVDPFAGMGISQAVALVYSNPELIRNGLPPILDNVPAVAVLVSAARNQIGGWRSLYMAASGSHSYGVDWYKYKSLIRKSLRSKDFEEQMFATGTLSVVQDVSKSTCTSINKILSRIDINALTQDQKLYLVNVLRPEPYYLAICAKQVIPLLENAISDLVIGGQSAALLYKIASSEVQYQKLKMHSPKTAARVRDLRIRAKNIIEVQRTAVKIGTLKPLAFGRNKAIKVLSSDITYWSERAEENFDDFERNSKSDRIAFMKLEADLKQAIASLDLDAISGIASAIATYSGADIPPATLVALIETALGNPALESVRLELQIALDALKDTSVVDPV